MDALSVAVLLLATLAGQGSETQVLGTPIADFELRDAQGLPHRLRDWRERKLVVVAFLSTDCPLAKLYAVRLGELAQEFEPRGVALVALDPNEHDSDADITHFVEQHHLPYPVLRDAGNVVADNLGATRTAEVFVLDEQRVVRYHGRVDDQYGPGGHRAAPTRRDLALALEELLAGRPVSVPETRPVGCLIDRVRRPAPSAVTYCRDVAPIMQEHCVSCHRPGQIGPFALTSYQEAAGQAEMIAEVVRQGRMPPWHADPQYGHFANNPTLSDREKEVLADWVSHGAPEGDPADLPPLRTFAGDWDIGKPDLVVPIPQPITVPATGVVEYQTVDVDPGFREDRWVQAAEVRPGNRAVVHHCIVFLKPPGSNEIAAQGELGSFYLAGTAPGTPGMTLPPGMAKKVPAGWHFVFVLHYAPIGSVQTDQTSLGLIFADPKTVRKEVATNILVDTDLCIPPHAADHRVEQATRMERDVLLLAMFPHMHLRGKSFRYEVDYPDGSREVLLDIPRYDFNWQNRYVLAEPKLLPAGSVLRCVAHYDNSAANPVNPDPNVTVHTGPQSWDEMFNGYYELALADQDLTRPPTLAERLTLARRRLFAPLPTLLYLSVGGTFLVFSRFRRNRQADGRPLPG